MSVPKLSLTFSQPVRYWPYCFMLAMSLAAGGAWLYARPAASAVVPMLDKAPANPALPPKASQAQQALLLGMRQHPWRLLAALNATQVEGVRVTAMQWRGRGSPLQLTAEVGQEAILPRWQQKLSQQFTGVVLRSAEPVATGQVLRVQLEMQWPH